MAEPVTENDLHTDLRELVLFYSREHGIQIQSVQVQWLDIKGMTDRTHELDRIEVQTMIGRQYGDVG